MEATTAVADDDKGRNRSGDWLGWDASRRVYEPFQPAFGRRVYDYARRTGRNSHYQVVYSGIVGTVSILLVVVAVILEVVK